MGCQPSAQTAVVQDFDITVTKGEDDPIGADLGRMGEGACFVRIKPGGIFERWNQEASDECQIHQGYIISEVNGVTGYWNILQELREVCTLCIRISATPPPGASLNYFQDVARVAEDLETRQDPAFLLRLQPQDPKARSKPRLSTFPRVRAGDAGVDLCGICLEDVDPDKMVVQLPCGHGYHALCAVRWLAESRSFKAHGNRQCCPFCCRRVVGTSGGGIATVDQLWQ